MAEFYLFLRILQVSTFVLALLAVSCVVGYFAIQEFRSTWKGDHS